MWRSLFNILGLFFAATSLALADQPLASLQGVENAQLRDRLAEVLGRTEADRSDEIAMRRNLRTARDRAIRFLRSRGYYAATVDSALDDENQPTLTIETGPPFEIGSVAIESGLEAANAAALAAIVLPANNSLTAEWVIETEALALAAIENAGWPEARALPRDVVIDHERQAGDVVFNFQTGLFSRFGGVELLSDGWRPAFIERLADLEAGTPASLEMLNALEGRLIRLASVRDANIRLGPPDEQGDEQRPLLVELEPAPRHAVETTLGFSTTEGAGVTGAISRRNIFGGDETLTLSTEIATLVQSLEARLNFPHWRRLNQGLELHTGVKSEDTDAFQQEEVSAGLDFYRDLEDGLTFSAGGIADFSRVTDATGVRDISSLRGNFALALDQREDPLDPQDGVQAAIILRPGYSFGDTDSLYLQTELRGSAYYPLSEHLVLAARARVGSTMGTNAIDLPADQRFYAGGGGSVRGFEFQSLSPIGPDGAPFGGLSVVEFSGEARWRGYGRWGAIAFIDSGFASASRTPELDDLRTGIGLGLRYYLDFAPIRLDLATPLDRRAGEDSVHVYISIGQAF